MPANRFPIFLFVLVVLLLPLLAWSRWTASHLSHPASPKLGSSLINRFPKWLNERYVFVRHNFPEYVHNRRTREPIRNYVLDRETCSISELPKIEDPHYSEPFRVSLTVTGKILISGIFNHDSPNAHWNRLIDPADVEGDINSYFCRIHFPFEEVVGNRYLLLLRKKDDRCVLTLRDLREDGIPEHEYSLPFEPRAIVNHNVADRFYIAGNAAKSMQVRTVGPYSRPAKEPLILYQFEGGTIRPLMSRVGPDELEHGCYRITDNEILYLSPDETKIEVFNLETGESKWQRAISRTDNGKPLPFPKRRTFPQPQPLIWGTSNNIVTILESSNTLGAFSLIDGRDLPKGESADAGPFSISDSEYYLITKSERRELPQNSIEIRDSRTGKLKSNFSLPAGTTTPLHFSPERESETITFIGPNDRVIKLDSNSGKTLETVDPWRKNRLLGIGFICCASLWTTLMFRECRRSGLHPVVRVLVLGCLFFHFIIYRHWHIGNFFPESPATWVLAATTFVTGTAAAAILLDRRLRLSLRLLPQFLALVAFLAIELRVPWLSLSLVDLIVQWSTIMIPTVALIACIRLLGGLSQNPDCNWKYRFRLFDALFLTAVSAVSITVFRFADLRSAASQRAIQRLVEFGFWRDYATHTLPFVIASVFTLWLVRERRLSALVPGTGFAVAISIAATIVVSSFTTIINTERIAMLMHLTALAATCIMTWLVFQPNPVVKPPSTSQPAS